MILSCGTVSLDWIQTTSGARSDVLGGSAIYFAAAAIRSGPVRTLGIVGQDFPLRLLEPLESLGVDLGGIRSSREKTFRWAARYDHKGDRRTTIARNREVLQAFSPVLCDVERHASAVFLGSADPRLQRVVLDQLPKRGHPTRPFVALDSMSHWIREHNQKIWDLASEVDLFLGNDEELGWLTGQRDLEEAARAVLSAGPSMVVVKHGTHGSTAVTEDLVLPCPAIPVATVDPTGAGDAFAGGFIGSWLGSKHLPLRIRVEEALHRGSQCGALATAEFSFEALLPTEGGG